MRILFLNYEYPPLGGGAGNATFYLLRELAKEKDISIDLLTSSTGEYREENFSPNIKIYFLNINKRDNLHDQSQWDLLNYSRQAWRTARKLMNRHKYDLVHAFFGVPCGYLAMKTGLPYIVSLRGSDVPFYSQKYKLLDRLIFKKLSRDYIWRHAAAVVANSEDLRQLALQSSPVQKISVIPNGVDTTKFYPDSKQKNFEFTIIYNSRFIERKGIRYLIDAFIQFAKEYRNVRLLTMSTGSLEAEMKERIRRAGLASRAEFHGFIDPKTDRIAANYRRGHVFVLPSLNEGMSNSLLEAMASGLPIITTKTGGSSKLIKKNGIIVPKRSSAALQQALRKIINSPDLGEGIGRQSRQLAESHSWQSVALAYQNVYHQVLNKRLITLKSEMSNNQYRINSK